jgi:hypothetical protein
MVNITYYSTLGQVRRDSQFAIELRLKSLFALHGTADHGHDDERRSGLAANLHGGIDGDADCEGGFEGGEGGRHDGCF